MRAVREPTSVQTGWSTDRVRMGHPSAPHRPPPRPDRDVMRVTRSHGTYSCVWLVSCPCLWSPQEGDTLQRRCRHGTWGGPRRPGIAPQLPFRVRGDFVCLRSLVLGSARSFVNLSLVKCTSLLRREEAEKPNLWATLAHEI